MKVVNDKEQALSFWLKSGARRNCLVLTTGVAYNNGANWQGGTAWADSDADAAAAAADGRGEDACSHTSCGITVVPGRGR